MKNLLRALFSMGLLGWVFMFMALAIFVGSFAAIANLISFETTWQRIDALDALEGDISMHVREVQLNELFFAYALDYETALSDELDAAAYHADEIDRLLDELEAEGHFTADLDYYEEDIALYEEVRALLDQHRESFAGVVESHAAGDVEGAVAGTLALQEEHEELQWTLHELIASLDADRLDAAQTFPEDIAFALQGVSAATVAMLLLALVGYRVIAQMTRPVVDLTNAVIAIGGDRYRPEVLGRLLKRGGPVGRLARALDAFARAIEERDVTRKAAIGNLREELYQSRRRRLKISNPER